jgi:putative acetyltransferase
VIRVSTEEAGDAGAIRRVHEQAFGGPAEADLVDALRASESWLPELSLVAVEDGLVIGHVLFTRAALDSGFPVLALAPMGVTPDRQRAGVGTALLREGLRRAATTDFPLVVVVGHAGYYPRFGFEPARGLGLSPPFPVPDEAWMALRLPAHDPRARGRVVYPPAFDAVS